jgi:ribosomal protein S27AE
MTRDYEKECPRCGLMLDYVFSEKTVDYWCHRCEYTATYKLPVENKEEE